MKKYLYLLWGVVAALIILETLLRVMGLFKTYSEINFNTYQSPYSADHASYLYLAEPNDTMTVRQVEFEYTYYTNNLGFYEAGDIETCDSLNKIVFLGDSFVFGVGAPQDSSVVAQLEKKLDIPIINAGFPGSDPFFQSKLIDSIFSKRNCHQFIFMVNFSDLYDYVFRGGFERFKVSKTLQYRRGPKFEKIYKVSFVARAIVHGILKYDYSLLPPSSASALKKESVIAYNELFKQMNEKYNIIVMIQPYPRQFDENSEILSEVLNYSYLEQLHELLKQSGIPTINLNEGLSEQINEMNYLNYSWKLDGHFNAKGYCLLADIIANELTLNHPEFVNADTDE